MRIDFWSWGGTFESRKDLLFLPFTQSKVILFSRKGGGELRIFHCNFLGYVRCHNFASEQLCVKPSRLIKILTFIQGGRERQSSMKCNEALLKSYSSLQHDPHFQNSFSKMTWQYLLLVVPIILMKKTSFSTLTYFTFLQGKERKMHWNCNKILLLLSFSTSRFMAKNVPTGVWLF